jgi:hypothetical protein
LALHLVGKAAAWKLWFYGGWCVFLYWSWPCLAFVAELHAEESPTAAAIARCYDNTVAAFERFRVVNGELVPHRAGSTPQGHRAVGRHMDRGNAIPRGQVLCGEVGAWGDVCKKLAKLPKPFSMKAAMDIMRNGNLAAFHGENDSYGCLGLLRLLACVMHDNTFADEERDWLELRAMSEGVRDKLRALQLWDYSHALQCRNTLRKMLGRCYSLSDLVCFVCLSE